MRRLVLLDRSAAAPALVGFTGGVCVVWRKLPPQGCGERKSAPIAAPVQHDGAGRSLKRSAKLSNRRIIRGSLESIFHIVGTSSTCPLDLRQLTELLSQRTCRLCAMRRLMRRSKNAALFDDLVGPSEQRWGNRESECPRRLEINC